MTTTIHDPYQRATRHWTPRELAETAAVSLKTVRRAIWAGKLPHVRIGSQIRIKDQDARAWLDGRTA